MTKATHVFLSYRNLEADFALRLATDLKNSGIDLWMDRLDIKPGEDWPRALQRGVDSCKALIAVLSPAYLESRYCTRELARADRLELLIYPILLAPIQPSEVPIEIERSQFIDFSGWRDPQVYQQKLAQLLAVLRERKLGGGRTPPPPEQRYLTRLIARLETYRAVREYTEPEEDVDLPVPAHKPMGEDIWQQRDAFILLQGITAHLIDTNASYKKHTVQLSGIQEAFSKYPAFLLVGEPGCGKTTVLYRMALEAAHACLSDAEQHLLPAVIDLARWGDGQPLEEFIRQHWQEELPQRPISDFALYFDGLDVLYWSAPRKLELLRQWLHSAAAPKHLYMSSRVDTYALLKLDLPTILMEEMDEQHIRELISTYIPAMPAQALLSRILPAPLLPLGSEHLFHLARKPHFLFTLIQVYRDAAGLHPETSGAVLREVVARLWQWAGALEGADWLTMEDMEGDFASLALMTLEPDAPDLISREFALEHLGDARVLEAGLRTRFMDVLDGHVQFYHPVLRAYFAAVGLHPERLLSVVPYPEFDPEGSLILDDWYAVVLYHVGLLDAPDATLLLLGDYNPFLAVRCIIDGVQVEPETHSHLLVLLANAVSTSMPEGRLEAARLLLAIQESDLPEKEIAQLVLDVLRFGPWEQRMAAVDLLSALELPELPALEDYLRGDYTDVRENVALALHQIGVKALPLFEHMLRHENQHTRRAVLRSLGELRDRAAAPLLIREIEREPDSLLLRDAVDALGWIRDPATLPQLVRLLYDANWRVRRAAQHALLAFEAHALPAVLETLKASDAEARRLAVEMLGDLGGQDAVPALIGALRDTQVDVRAAAIRALGRVGAYQAEAELVECLEDTTKPRFSKNRICDLAAEVLAQIGSPVEPQTSKPAPDVEDPQTMPLPITGGGEIMINAKKPEQRDPSEGSASKAKGRLQSVTGGDPAVKQRLAALRRKISSDQWLDRQQSVQALGDLGPDAMPILFPCIKDTQVQVRMATVTALEKIRTPAAVMALLRMLFDSDAVVYDAAGEALARIGKVAVPGLLKVLQTQQPAARGVAVETLGKIGDAAAVPALIQCLGDHSTPWLAGQPINQMAALALRMIGTEHALQAVKIWQTEGRVPDKHELLLNDEDTKPVPGTPKPTPYPTVLGQILRRLRQKTIKGTDREEAARALREYAKAQRGRRDPALVEELVRLLGDEDWFVRSAGAEALGWLRDAQSIGPLIKTLNDPAWTVRIAVIYALAELKDTQIAPYILPCLQDEQSQVREVAAEALGVLGNQQTVEALITALNDQDEFVRQRVAQALGLLRSPLATPALLHALEDRHKGVRWNAVVALGRIAPPEAVPALIRRLNDEDRPTIEDVPICEVAALALEVIGTQAAVQALAAWRRDAAGSRA